MCVRIFFFRAFIFEMEHLFTPPHTMLYILQFIIQVNCLIIVRFSSKGNSLCVQNFSTICPSVYASFVLFIQRRPAIVECHPRTAISFTVIPSTAVSSFVHSMPFNWHKQIDAAFNVLSFGPFYVCRGSLAIERNEKQVARRPIAHSIKRR